ncbi:class II D-tagatose-bisphosphate aldolase, non-catalytic subunit [candidate division KSB1 bacterium]|nr:class II D-tagatose-bisphosphate aldolase, non-catalytic subunit [candidate division KSB1 bacterium]
MNDIELRKKALSNDVSFLDYILSKIKVNTEKSGVHSTIFAACPNSEDVIKASLRAAKRANAPIAFAATLNQVDRDGGYTRMTQQQFVKKVRLEAEAICYDGPIIIGLDHGGPWLKDIQAINKWDLEKCMDWLKKSLEASIEAGYDLLHIDPTVDITLEKGKPIPIELVVDRTVELIRHAEKFRREAGYPRVAYEVGTEEVHGGLANMEVFQHFLSLLKQGLAEHSLEDVWPCFVVGKVGTDLHTTFFDPETAKQLITEASKYGSVIKGHYTDEVTNPEAYPESGMGGANVGPEFTSLEYDALSSLSLIEEDLEQKGRIAVASQIMKSLKSAVVESGRWKKWLLKDEIGKDFDSLSAERQDWLLKTGCRYIWTDDRVYASRSRLYENLTRNGILVQDALLMKIEQAMDKYFRAFNLINLNDIL